MKSPDVSGVPPKSGALPDSEYVGGAYEALKTVRYLEMKPEPIRNGCDMKQKRREDK